MGYDRLVMKMNPNECCEGLQATTETCARPTLCTVAKAAGVSKSTVSRVVNNDREVKPDTVLAVREAMERLEYQPKPVHNRPGPRVRKRKPVRHQQVGLLFGGKPNLLHTPVYSRVLQGVEKRLSEDGWNLVVRTLPTERPWEAMPHRLDGVLLFSAHASHPRLMRELRKTTALRIMGQSFEGDFFDHVTYDEERIGQVAAAYLAGCGHERLACLHAGGTERCKRFVRAAREAGAEVTEIFKSNLVDESGKVHVPVRKTMVEIAEELARMNPRPTGIYVGTDIVVTGLHPALLAAGLKPGVDIEIVGTNNDAALLNYLHPRPASVDIHAEAVGRRAVEQLYWRLDHGRELRQIIKLDPEIALI